MQKAMNHIHGTMTFKIVFLFRSDQLPF